MACKGAHGVSAHEFHADWCVDGLFTTPADLGAQELALLEALEVHVLDPDRARVDVLEVLPHLRAQGGYHL